MEQKRSLTESDINTIVKKCIFKLPGIPHEIAQTIQDHFIQSESKRLRNIKIYPSKIPHLIEILSDAFRRAQIEPGKMVGALSSSSIGEKNTQTSLSSFHTAGQSKVELVTGVPRLEEILNVSKEIKTPSMTIYLNLDKEFSKELKNVRRIAKHEFEYKELDDLLVDYCIIKRSEIEFPVWYEFFELYYGTEYEKCEYCIRLTFNPELLYECGKTLQHISEIIQKEYADAYCVFSPDNIGIIDVYIDTSELVSIDDVITNLRTVRKRKRNNEAMSLYDNADNDKDKNLSKYDEDDQDIFMLITDENKEFYFVRDLVIPSLLYIRVSGIEFIKKCFYDEKDGIWIIKTKGTNMKKVITHPFVDHTKTTSNHLWDIYETFGIEACKIFMVQEIHSLLPVAYSHIKLLVSCMAYAGKPCQATRYGIDKKQVGPLAKMSFEQPFDNLLLSATIAEKENLSGVSSSITFGLCPPIGSHFSDVVDAQKGEVINEDKLIYDFEQQLLVKNQSYDTSVNKGIAKTLIKQQENVKKPVETPKAQEKLQNMAFF
jgi:DNA-directed RNA polymerase II subunit RPB1